MPRHDVPPRPQVENLPPRGHSQPGTVLARSPTTGSNPVAFAPPAEKLTTDGGALF